jgi:hypothetical protein
MLAPPRVHLVRVAGDFRPRDERQPGGLNRLLVRLGYHARVADYGNVGQLVGGHERLDYRQHRLMDRTAAQLLMQALNDPVAGRARISLAAALQQLFRIEAPACGSFISTLRADLDVWRHIVQSLPVIGNLAAAARYFRLLVMTGSRAPNRT